ncbi:hypothetical protein B5X24_HaOG207168 [Helicoverpa armigera]|uniref:CCHC-type domain-containing protein n=1 Tax=Helicoverpa armigera TaxID=29058 RepID=A0A2W1BME7_HELAM|nr:hypothetical protein B5X24_HaOG207168 [Helicoverpa armigera]
MMAARKKKKDEKCLDYMLVMKEMGKRGKMPDYVAIKYIIDGIVDSEVNKMVLYGATTYSELKEKIKIYDVMREKMCASSNRNNKPGNSDKAAYQSYKRCYSCGGRNHQSSECPNKEKGLKCFKCNEFGHISTQCKQQGETVRSRTSDRNGERRNEKPKVSDDRRAMCVADFTTCDYEVGKPDECGSHDSSLDNSIGRTNISGNNKMAYQIGTDTNFKDIYVEEKTPAQIRFENACKKIFVNQCGVTALIDSGNIMNKQVQQEVIECVKSYNPVQIKEAPIELRIVLKDDIPIAQRPRRISLAEQQLVEKQVAEWLKDGIIRPLMNFRHCNA